MKYKVVKTDGWWNGYVWDENCKSWDRLFYCSALTKLGCKHLINQHHKKLKSNFGIKSEKFELE